MKTSKVHSDMPVGRILERLRQAAKLTQEQLADKVTFKTSPASISRIEDGGKQVSDDELSSILKAIGTPKADEFAQYLHQNWDMIDRPPFDHPNRPSLWQANLALRKLARLRDKPDLKGVFVRQIDLYERELLRVAEFLQSCDHQIAFIGCIGVGKSTAICKLDNLLKPGENKLDREIVLESGAGGITLCEVHITNGPRHGLRIEPRTRDSIEKDVEDFAEYLFKATRSDPTTVRQGAEEEGDVLGISKEVVRAIRNMADLTEKRKEEGGKKVRVDPAKELAAQFTSATELAIQILSRMALPRRSRRDLWYPEDATQPPMHWLQQVFSDVNNGRHPDITLPARIEVIVPKPVFASEQLPLKLIDTKGVDQTAEREDLECHFDDPRTLVVLCTRFNDSPDIASQTLIHRAREAGVRDIEKKTALLVLPRPDEAMAVRHDGGGNVEDEAEGYELKRDQIDLRLSGLGASGLPVIFFNAKENDPEPVRDALVGQIVAYRGRYCKQIDQLAGAVDHLIKNQEDVTTRLVFEQVGQRLATWIDKNRELGWEDLPVQAPLVKAIGDTRYAATVRATIRRQGHWPNLDYYHHLAHGTRRVAVQVIGGKIEQFKIIIQNLIDDDELSPAREFLNRVVQSLDVNVDAAYRTLQMAGQKAYKDELEKDQTFWDECEGRWGAARLVPGGKYRDEIREMTDEQFQSSYDTARLLLKDMIGKEWERLIGVLNGMLKEKGTEIGVTVKRK
jgi:transcriptional regulator with XRE-family HTH domain